MTIVTPFSASIMPHCMGVVVLYGGRDMPFSLEEVRRRLLLLCLDTEQRDWAARLCQPSGALTVGGTILNGGERAKTYFASVNTEDGSTKTMSRALLAKLNRSRVRGESARESTYTVHVHEKKGDKITALSQVGWITIGSDGSVTSEHVTQPNLSPDDYEAFKTLVNNLINRLEMYRDQMDRTAVMRVVRGVLAYLGSGFQYVVERQTLFLPNPAHHHAVRLGKIRKSIEDGMQSAEMFPEEDLMVPEDLEDFKRFIEILRFVADLHQTSIDGKSHNLPFSVLPIYPEDAHGAMTVQLAAVEHVEQAYENIKAHLIQVLQGKNRVRTDTSQALTAQIEGLQAQAAMYQHLLQANTARVAKELELLNRALRERIAHVAPFTQEQIDAIIGTQGDEA
jgi:hypothetical protein